MRTVGLMKPSKESKVTHWHLRPNSKDATCDSERGHFRTSRAALMACPDDWSVWPCHWNHPEIPES